MLRLCLLLCLLGVLSNPTAASVQYAPAPSDDDKLYLPINVPQAYPDPPPPPPIPVDIPGIEVPVEEHGPVLANSTYGLLPYKKDQRERMKTIFIVKPLFDKSGRPLYRKMLHKSRINKNSRKRARGKPTSSSSRFSPRFQFADGDETPKRITTRNKAYVLVDTAQVPDDLLLYYIIRRKIYN